MLTRTFGHVLVLGLVVSAAAYAQAPKSPVDPGVKSHIQLPPEPGAALAKELRSKTAALMEDVAASVDGVMGYAIIDLTNGASFERMADVPLPTASTIKLAILYELVKRADEGSLKLDDTITLDRQRAVPGGLLYELGTPTLSLRDYANCMIIESDNTATNVLMARLGMDAITARMEGLGLSSIKLRRYMIDLEAAKKGRENVATPGDLARLLRLFYKSEGLTPTAQGEALQILKKFKNTPIRRGVPASVEIASKPGGLEGVASDTAIVYAKNRPFVIVVMGTYLQDESAAQKAIERITQIAYNYFARLGSASPQTGRLLGN